MPLRPASVHSTVEPFRAASLFSTYDISRLPQLTEATAQVKKRQFKTYPIGYFHIDITEVATAEGKLHLFVAIDRTAKFAVARLEERANTKTAADFLHCLVETVPYRIHTVLTDNGIQFADLPKNRQGATALWRGHPFDRACWQHRIEHRLTKPNHPWTNGQVERMNRTMASLMVWFMHISPPFPLSMACICHHDERKYHFVFNH